MTPLRALGTPFAYHLLLTASVPVLDMLARYVTIKAQLTPHFAKMALKESARLKERKAPAPTYPPNHKPAMRVPKGGSSCSSCRYLAANHHKQPICTNIHFIRWHEGGMILPLPPEEYCSDWYEPMKGVLST